MTHVVDGVEMEFTDYAEIARLFCEAISVGQVPACRYVIQAAKRYLNMLRKAASGKAPYVFSPAHAADYLSFFESLPFVEDNWRGVASAPAEPWWIWVGCATYGFRSRQTGARWTSETYIEVPRKHYKSGGAASIGLYDLLNGTLAPSILIAARKEEQANKVFNPMKRWSETQTDLIDEFKIECTLKRIRCGFNGGEVVKLSSMGKREDGWNPTTAILEEAHAQDPSVYEVIDSARGARAGQLIFQIGTAGHSPSGHGFSIRQKAVDMLGGKFEDEKFFGLIYTVDEEDLEDLDRLLTDERLIAKANPMLGVSLDPEEIRRAAQNAWFIPSKRAEFLRTRFNVWANATKGLVDPVAYDRCKADIDISQFIGARCWIGIDMSVYHDMAAAVLIFEVGDSIAMFAKMYLPEGSHVVQSPSLHGAVVAWREGGYLTVFPGAMIDEDSILADLIAFGEVFQVDVFAFDPAYSLHLMKSMNDRGFPVVSFKVNSKTMALPSEDLVGRIAGGRLLHDGNPCLAWNFMNACGDRRRDGTVLPTKDREGSERKMDAFAAACYANGVRLDPAWRPELKQTEPSPYETRGILGVDDA